MRNNSHTLIGSARSAVQTWRKRNNWSRETVCQVIIETYTELAGADVIGLRFDPPTTDAIERQKINAERIFRWLDDESKDNNLLPANFLPYLIAALPKDLRIELADRLLEFGQLTVRVAETNKQECLVQVLQAMAREVGEATASMAGLLDGATPEELANAQKEVTEAIGACNVALQVVESYKSKGSVHG